MAHLETTDIFKGAFFLSQGGNLSGISFNDRQIATIRKKGTDLFSTSANEEFTGFVRCNG
jgi:hypothetical protein